MGRLHGVRELPEWFVARSEHLHNISVALRAEGVQPIVVSSKQKTVTMHGMGGIGKTTLAIALCRNCDVRRFFPDGVFWLELGKSPDIALRMGDIGEAFGVLREEFPDEGRGKSRLGAILEDKAALIVLDDVWDYRHADAFRVTGGRCRLLITTRRPRIHIELGGVEYELDILSEDEGLALFALRHGVEREALLEADTLRAIIHQLGGHTLSLNIAAAKIKEHGIAFALRYLERLQTQDNPFADLRLEDTDDKNVNVEASLNESYRELSEDLQRRFRALGIFTVAGTFDVSAAAAVWGDTDLYLAEDRLHELERASLLDRVGEGRYNLHKLLCSYTRALLEQHKETNTTFARYADYIIDSITTKFSTIPPEEWEASIGQDIPHVLYIGDKLQRIYTSASIQDDAFEIRALRFSLYTTHFVFSRPELWRTNWLEMGLTVSQKRQDLGSEALFLNELGYFHSLKGDQDKALANHAQALKFHRAVQNRQGEAAALNNMGQVYIKQGEHRKTLECCEQALVLYRLDGDQRGEATTLNNIGHVNALLGNQDSALEYYELALRIHHDIGNRKGEATTLNNIGYIYSLRGEYQKVLEYYEQALKLHRAVGNQQGEAITLNNIGGIYETMKQPQNALKHYEEAVTKYRTVGDRHGEATTLHNIGYIYSTLRDEVKALKYYGEASSLRHTIGDRHGEATSLNNMGRAYSVLGDRTKALEFFQEALSIRQPIEDRDGEAVTYFNMGITNEHLGNLDTAIVHLQRSFDIMVHIGHDELEKVRIELNRLKRQRGDADAHPESEEERQVRRIATLYREEGAEAVRKLLEQAGITEDEIDNIIMLLKISGDSYI